MPARVLTILTCRNLPQFQQPRQPQPSTINEKTLDFTRVVEAMGVLDRADTHRSRRLHPRPGHKASPRESRIGESLEGS